MDSSRKIKTIFLHRSTGANLLYQGEVRKLLKEKNPNIEFWDHGYNISAWKKLESWFAPYLTGLSNPQGYFVNKDFDIPGDNTNPDGLDILFALNPNEENALKKLLEFDVIIYKSCYPTTKIKSEEELREYKDIYTRIGYFTEKYKNKLFIAFTPPPLRKELTKSEYAKNANEFVEWMNSEGFIQQRSNLKVFNFFGLLAERDEKDSRFNTLKKTYCKFMFFDSHPNKRANKEIAPLFVDFFVENVNTFFTNQKI